MADQSREAKIKALDGTIKTIDNGVTKPSPVGSGVSLASRPKDSTAALRKDSVPPPGQTLTGKQEHCMLGLELGIFD